MMKQCDRVISMVQQQSKEDLNSKVVKLETPAFEYQIVGKEEYDDYKRKLETLIIDKAVQC